MNSTTIKPTAEKAVFSCALGKCEGCKLATPTVPCRCECHKQRLAVYLAEQGALSGTARGFSVAVATLEQICACAEVEMAVDDARLYHVSAAEADEIEDVSLVALKADQDDRDAVRLFRLELDEGGPK